jgi:hypothetical protein
MNTTLGRTAIDHVVRSRASVAWPGTGKRGPILRAWPAGNVMRTVAARSRVPWATYSALPVGSSSSSATSTVAI